MLQSFITDSFYRE
uniref:Uncharacterized protein n=1 Tax=Anguilla anguilla TaxID=7936 RepID=A0A0E9PTI4_ANGAN